VTDHEQTKIEVGLRQIRPGKVPGELLERLRTVESLTPVAAHKARVPVFEAPRAFWCLRWLIPATAAVLIVAAIRQAENSSNQPTGSTTSPPLATAAPAALQADSVEVYKELVSSYDAVAKLPGGESVRFRCQQWRNKVVVDDQKQGLLVENWTPRVVVVPVGFETY